MRRNCTYKIMFTIKFRYAKLLPSEDSELEACTSYDDLDTNRFIVVGFDDDDNMTIRCDGGY